LEVADVIGVADVAREAELVQRSSGSLIYTTIDQPTMRLLKR